MFQTTNQITFDLFRTYKVNFGEFHWIGSLAQFWNLPKFDIPGHVMQHCHGKFPMCGGFSHWNLHLLQGFSSHGWCHQRLAFAASCAPDEDPILLTPEGQRPATGAAGAAGAAAPATGESHGGSRQVVSMVVSSHGWLRCGCFNTKKWSSMTWMDVGHHHF